MDAFLTTDGLIALVTLSLMEIVLGVDNLVFIAILTGRLPPDRQPLARRLDCKVDMREEFFEGADPATAISLLLEMAPQNPVICSHGDLIPKMIRRLVADGMKTKDPNISQKASLWLIEVDNGRPVKGKYYPPS